MKKQRTVAKYTGYALILMALIAGFSLGYAFPKIYNTNQLELAQNNLFENLELYKFMLFDTFGLSFATSLAIVISRFL